MDFLNVEHITKSFDTFKAVNQASFKVSEGMIYGLLGPNGAGKTTTMRMIMNIIIPDSGKIEIFGESFNESHKNRIGYLPEERGLYSKMKLLSHLQFFGELRGLSASKSKKIASEWLERFNLGEWSNRKVQDLSKGMQQKVQFIGIILHQPDLLIIDEPFSGLDPINTKFLKDVLLEFKAQGKAIILSTHLMDQAEKLCEGICLINRGEVVMAGDLSEIKKKHGRDSVVIEYQGNAKFVQQLPGVKTVNDYGNYMEIQLQDQSDPDPLLKAVVNSDLRISRYEISESSLNDIFIDLVGR